MSNLRKRRNVEAEAALRAATRIEPTFAAAWYNLGDLLDEQGRSEAAIECLRKTLQVAPDYVDSMFNLALLLQRKNQCADAADYWRRYLAIDGQSEWAMFPIQAAEAARRYDGQRKVPLAIAAILRPSFWSVCEASELVRSGAHANVSTKCIANLRASGAALTTRLRMRRVIP